LGASASGPSSINFLKDYVPLKKPTTKQVKLPKELKYELLELEIPPGVIVEEDMLDAIGNLKYVDHDLTDIKKFLELAPNKYRTIKLTPNSQAVIVDPWEWATWLKKISILNL